jgi:hypothetical protein
MDMISFYGVCTEDLKVKWFFSVDLPNMNITEYVILNTLRDV